VPVVGLLRAVERDRHGDTSCGEVGHRVLVQQQPVGLETEVACGPSGELLLDLCGKCGETLAAEE